MSDSVSKSSGRVRTFHLQASCACYGSCLLLSSYVSLPLSGCQYTWTCVYGLIVSFLGGQPVFVRRSPSSLSLKTSLLAFILARWVCGMLAWCFFLSFPTAHRDPSKSLPLPCKWNIYKGRVGHLQFKIPGPFGLRERGSVAGLLEWWQRDDGGCDGIHWFRKSFEGHRALVGSSVPGN